MYNSTGDIREENEDVEMEKEENLSRTGFV